MGSACARTALAWLIFGALALTIRAQSPRLLDAAYLNSLRAEVRTNHPSVAAAHARVLASEAGVSAVRLWEDPMAGVGVMAAERGMRRDDGDILILAEQSLPRRKLYEARRARAVAERSVLEAEARSTALTLETLVAQTTIELALADEMFSIQTNQLRWLEGMAANARERLKDPLASASEPLRIESEVAQQRQNIDATARDRARLARQLNILLGRPPDQLWPTLRFLESPGTTPSMEAELSRLTDANPMLQAILNTSKAAKLEMEVARRERSPTFSLGLDSRVYSGGDFRETTVGAKITLPWFNNSIYRANVERARQQALAAEYEVEALARRLRGETVAAHTLAENAAHQAATYSNEIIPRAQKAAESTRNTWISSKASLLEVLDSQRSLLTAQLEQRRLVAAHLAALETLRAIVPPPTHP